MLYGFPLILLLNCVRQLKSLILPLLQSDKSIGEFIPFLLLWTEPGGVSLERPGHVPFHILETVSRVQNRPRSSEKIGIEIPITAIFHMLLKPKYTSTV